MSEIRNFGNFIASQLHREELSAIHGTWARRINVRKSSEFNAPMCIDVILQGEGHEWSKEVGPGRERAVPGFKAVKLPTQVGGIGNSKKTKILRTPPDCPGRGSCPGMAMGAAA